MLRKREIFLLILICAWILNVFANEILASIYPFSGHFDDGTFQIFNPIRRIEAGQIMGQDFFFFHGILVPYIIYPFYKLSKLLINDFNLNGLYSVEIAKQLTPFFFFIPITFVLTRSLIKDRFFSLCVFLLFLYWSVPLMYRGEGSLLSLRSLAPLLVIGTYAYKNSLFIYSLRGLFLALSVLSSTEHGLMITIAVIIFEILQLFKEALLKKLEFKKTILKYLSLLGAFIFSISLILIALKINWSTLCKILEFNYKIVPSEQFWYFGSPPAWYFFTWDDFKELLIGKRLVSDLFLSILLFFYFIYLYYKKDLNDKNNEINAGLVFLLYGMISVSSCLGISALVYLFPSERAIFFCVFLLLGLYYKKYKINIKPKNSHSIQSLLLCSILAFCFFFQPISKIITLTKKPPYLNKTDKIVNWDFWYSSVSKYVLNKDFNFAWSTYTSLIESQRGTFNPHTDYIIHALGNQKRQEYLETFKKTQPDLVQSFRKDSSRWQEWLEVSYWEFWDYLIDHYQVYAFIGHSVFWCKTSKAITERSDWLRVDSKYNPKHFLIDIPNHEGYGLYLLKFEYKIKNYSQFPFINRLNKFFVSIFNSANTYSVSLTPYKSEALIPIYINASIPNQKFEIQIADLGLFSHLTEIEVFNPQYQWVKTSEETYKALHQYYDYKRANSHRNKLQFYDFILNIQNPYKRILFKDHELKY